MRAFTDLFLRLDRTSRTHEKVAALADYFRSAPAADAAWALWFLSGKRCPRAVTANELRTWTAELAGLPEWLVAECYDHVGDLAETLALLLPPAPVGADELSLSILVHQRLQPLAGQLPPVQRETLRKTWMELDGAQRFLWNKLITGGFRVGVSRALIVRALADVAGVEPAVMNHRLMGEWRPTAESLLELFSTAGPGDDPARPYPFYLASGLEGQLHDLGDPASWQVEWKWDGIRAQILKRAEQVVIWSRGEELITSAFPEITDAARGLPNGTVMDGELLAWRGEGPLPFACLQRRLNRKSAGTALQAEVPIVFLAFDLLECQGLDLRSRPLKERRSALAEFIGQARQRNVSSPETRSVAWVQDELFADPKSGADGDANAFPLRLSPVVDLVDWTELPARRAEARSRGAEGVMLKRLDSAYGVGRQRGAWWKWKLEPYTCDAVLVAAQPGHGRRASLFTDYTFAVWNGPELVPVAKAYSGLTDAEIAEVDAFVRANTTGRFGPVRTVQPEWVFEIAFEGIAESGRHRSGLALRFPRIARRRLDKRPADADTVEGLRRLAGLA
ncbi:MAG: ATP-dependent DNA ligase [Verrucomicrobiales bacterium]|nr:ATP-dependent DNA ligase [Verrucomicrobiales bacterium]